MSATGPLAEFALVLLACCRPVMARASEAVPTHPQRCAGAEYHRMDYLLGDWDVVETATGKHFLFNKVEPINDGCAVRESLVMQKGVPGIRRIGGGIYIITRRECMQC